MRTIDLNADVGEGHDDLEIFPFVTSVSIACGAHAGDEATMERSVIEAVRLGVAIGAHPSYPDREGYGRRHIEIARDDLKASLVEQLAMLASVAARHSARLTHVKPHGALYNEASDDEDLARVVVDAIRSFEPAIALMALAGSALVSVASALGSRVIPEGFADRRYRPDGRLAARDIDGAVIDDPIAAAEQAVNLALGRPVEAIDGTPVRLEAATICIHSDTPDAANVARAVRRELERCGVVVAPR